MALPSFQPPVTGCTALGLALCLAAGCSSVEPTPPRIEWEPFIGFHFEDGYLAVNFGTTLVNAWAGGQIIGDPVEITADHTTPITSTFHDASSNLVSGLDEYVLMLVPADPSLLTFTRTRAFGGTLTSSGSGTTTVAVGLHNAVRALEDFGPFDVPVTVR